ncbi:MAG: hypothetical protein A3G74_07035 [Sulfurimonas sp. RIFCSPLOWO2_12_FULL_34_6]|nr:MAG: hypothetical protein A3G74_07035 [Sulfurimonas sp. RIFCSPLOWO2_12_FULL_34_6]
MKTLLLTTLITTQSLFALVSIAPVEIGKKPGFSNSIEGALETTRGNTEKDSYKVSARTTYDNNIDYIAWAEASGAYSKSNGKEDTNKLFAHTRYMHSITDKTFMGEIFIQLQNDEFKRINNRILGGGGVRLELFNLLQRGKGYFGIGGFYENINYANSTINPSENNLRVNSYFAYAIDLSKTSSVAYALYYQPKASDFSDTIQSHELELKLCVYRDLFLKFSISYDKDNRPPVGAQDYDLIQNTSFVYSF